MADEKEKKTTTAKAPAKTVRRVRKTAQKAETVQKKPEVQKEERSTRWNREDRIWSCNSYGSWRRWSS